ERLFELEPDLPAGVDSPLTERMTNTAEQHVADVHRGVRAWLEHGIRQLHHRHEEALAPCVGLAVALPALGVVFAVVLFAEVRRRREREVTRLGVDRRRCRRRLLAWRANGDIFGRRVDERRERLAAERSEQLAVSF